ncbi:hypothetical protein AL013_07525 [Mariprofundus ferrooxydans]|nr:hypothetical protein AL013_07525 [Mariprofundus ferrooxydans]
MPTELYNWIDQYAAKKRVSRSQCVCDLVKKARGSLSRRVETKQPWTIHAAKAGEYVSVGIILVDIQCMAGLL